MRLSEEESKLRRELLPYGVYIGKDGTETLFDRAYHPIIARDADGKNLRKAFGWIEHTKQVWFYDDGCSPHHITHADQKSYRKCAYALSAFIKGNPITPYIHSES